MLAISRALVTNPRLLIMDEPTEGLAPVIVAQVEEMLVRLGEEGDIAVLVIEQNIGVATAVSKNVAIMVNGRVNRLIEFCASCGRPRLATAPARSWTSYAGRDRIRCGGERRCRGTLDLLAPAGFGTDPSLYFKSSAADALVAAGADRTHRGQCADTLGRRVKTAGGRTAAPRHGSGAKRRAADRAGRRHAGHQRRGVPFIRDIVAGSGLRTRRTSQPAAGPHPATSPPRK